MCGCYGDHKEPLAITFSPFIPFFKISALLQSSGFSADFRAAAFVFTPGVTVHTSPGSVLTSITLGLALVQLGKETK